MILVVSSWYNEVGINFKISYKVCNYVRERIKDYIMTPLGLIDLDPNLYLSINVTTTATQDTLEVRFGRVTKRSEFIRIGFWMPYKKIITAENPLKEYLENYIEGTKIVFAKWNVKDEQIDMLKNDVFREILNNKEYEYADEE